MGKIIRPNEVLELKSDNLFTDDEFNIIKRYIDNGMINAFNENIQNNINDNFNGYKFVNHLDFSVENIEVFDKKFKLDLNKERINKYIRNVMRDADWMIKTDVSDDVVGLVGEKLTFEFYFFPYTHNEFTLLRKFFNRLIKKVKNHVTRFFKNTKATA